MNRSSLVSFLVLAALAAGAQAAFAQTPMPKNAPALPASAERKETLSTTTKTLEAISRAYHINIVAETFPLDNKPDYFMPTIRAEETGDPMEVFQGLTQRLGMEVTQRNGLYVVRRKNRAVYYKNQQITPPIWGNVGSLEITRLDKPYADVPFATDDAPDAKTPAQRIDINGSAITVSRLATALQDVNWTVHVDRNVSARRVNIYAKNISPSAILGAVAYLVNASEEVTLKASDAQLSAEYYDGFQFSDATRKRMGLSDALRPDMEKMLTKEQKATLGNGEYIAISFKDMPPGLQERALNYAKLAAQLDSDLVATPDLSKWKDFRIRFLPDTAGVNSRTLGVVTVASNGTEYFF